MIIEPCCAWLYTIFTLKICFPVFQGFHISGYLFPSRNQFMGERLGLGAESANHRSIPHRYQWESVLAPSHQVHVIH